MNVYEINAFQILSLTFMFKCKNKEAPQIFEKKHLYNIKTYNSYNIRSHGKLVKPFCKKKLTECSISFRGPKLWNELVISQIPNIHSISLSVFKKKIKNIISLLENILDYF